MPETSAQWQPEFSDGMPFHEELRALQAEINRLFPKISKRSPSPETPTFSLWFGEHEMVLSGELPDLDPASVRVLLEGQRLIVRGDLAHSAAASPAGAATGATQPAVFRRIFNLPWPIDPKSLSVTWTMGFLILQAHRLNAEA